LFAAAVVTLSGQPAMHTEMQCVHSSSVLPGSARVTALVLHRKSVCMRRGEYTQGTCHSCMDSVGKQEQQLQPPTHTALAGHALEYISLHTMLNKSR